MRLTIGRMIIYRDDRDQALCFFICMYLVMNAVNSVLQDVFRISGSLLSATKILIALIMMMLLVRPLIKFRPSERHVLIAAEGLSFFAYVWSWLLGAGLNRLADWGITTLLVCIPMAVAVGCIYDKETLYRYLLRFSWVIWLILYINMRGSIDDLYDMHFSYGLLLVMLLHLNELINTGNLFYIPCLLAQLYMMITYGSRGALVCIAVFVILKVITNIRNMWKRIAWLFAIGAVCIGLYIFMDRYAVQLYEWLLKNGYRSRTAKLLLTGRFATHDSGRGVLWECVLRLIKEKPFLGWGIRGAIDEMRHPYPHNFFLDCWLSFGIPAGTILAVFLVFPLTVVVTAEKGKYKDLLQIMLSIGFVNLMFSNTFFTNYYFFILLGLAVSARRRTVRYA